MGRFDPEANVSRFARMLYNETDPATSEIAAVVGWLMKKTDLPRARCSSR